MNSLRCGNVDRKTYLHFPELEEAERLKKEEKVTFEAELKKLDAKQRKQIEDYLEARKNKRIIREKGFFRQERIEPFHSYSQVNIKSFQYFIIICQELFLNIITGVWIRLQ